MKKLLVANRGEIAIRIFRAATELGIETVGIFAKEDEHSLHRYKADEAYLVGEGKQATSAYLDMDAIIAIAKQAGADAIHPGYGFLSENIEFARKCQQAGLLFVGPTLEQLDILGDKLKAKMAASKAGLQSIPGSEDIVTTIEQIYEFGEVYGYPIMIKAALGGGGRGMRVVFRKEDVAENYERAKGEAMKAFGSADCYVEKYIQNPKHIEVQILGDQHGNVVHLFERDCSVQRRHQKVVEVAPCVSLSSAMREKICAAAANFMRQLQYVNAGTVEFLVDGEAFYFIEVNPRIQVEHTITELITGIDLVQAQLLIAQGLDLHKEMMIPKQEAITIKGAAIQCRITTEDPENHFLPDTGKINTYRSPGGFGIRLDAGNAFQGNVVTPYFDSLLVKVCTYGSDFQQAARIMQRALKEFRIRGVKTNIPFLKNVIHHPTFLTGAAKTTFIDTTPALFQFTKEGNRGNKLLHYISDITINGYPGISHQAKELESPVYPEQQFEKTSATVNLKQLLDEKGALEVSKWVLEQREVLLTDTSFRDAHQSLMATRMRTRDLVQASSMYEKAMPQLFSAEVWGGATFDTAFRFLTENPWERLEAIRKQMPNTLLQMLLRGSNAVGYSTYPDNVIQAFIKEAAKSGIDIFRIFDSLNWLPQMEVSIQAVRDAGKIAEVAMCYTGDILDPMRSKYSLDYYLQLAKELEQSGAHMIAIKDMAGLLKPQAAKQLITALKEQLTVPIHLHTHDTSGNGILTIAKAVEAGVDIVDVAISSMAGGNSNPSLETLYHGLAGTDRQPKLNLKNIEKVNRYWSKIRKQYAAFDQGNGSPSPEVYRYEMPGGQYTNLYQQAVAVGLGDRWEEVQEMYRTVNQLFGDLIKVTPSSKVVGDMALFMVQNHLTEENIYEKGTMLTFPDSVIQFFRGELGQPVGGFPQKLQQLILKNEKALKVRPGSLVKPIHLTAIREELQSILEKEPTQQEILSYLMYPKVYVDYVKRQAVYGNVSILDTPTFFYGMRMKETIQVAYAPGKVMVITLVQIGEADHEGNRIMFYRFNGQSREIVVHDQSATVVTTKRPKADPAVIGQVGATMPGSILKLFVTLGETVKKGQVLLVSEAMKMETTIQSPCDGVITQILVEEQDVIDTGDLLLTIQKDS